MIYNDEDYLEQQLKKLRQSKHNIMEHAKELQIEKKRDVWKGIVRQREAEKQAARRNGLGCGLFVVVFLSWCFIACAPVRQLKTDLATVIDSERRLLDFGCHTPIIDPLTGQIEDSDWLYLFPQEICEEEEGRLIPLEHRSEDEIAKRRALEAFWREKVVPWATPYIEQGIYTSAQLILAYFTGNLLGGALQAVQQPP